MKRWMAWAALLSMASACDPEVISATDDAIVLGDVASDGGPASDMAFEVTPIDGYWRPDALVEPECPAGRFSTGFGCSAPWPCPDGWSPHPGGYGCEPPEVDCDDGIALLDDTCLAPWPCPDGWSREGDGPCLPAAVPCPDGFAVAGRCAPADGCVEPGAPAVYVDPMAPAGGDGSAERPFATVGQGMEAAGEVVALLGGAHRWPDDAPADGGALRGVCGQDVTLVGARVLGGDWFIGGLRLVGGERDGEPAPALEVLDGALTLRAVEVGPGPLGLLFEGGESTLVGVRLAGVEGAALRLALAARVTLDRVRIERSGPVVVGAVLTGSDVELVDLAPAALVADRGGLVALRRVLLSWSGEPAWGVLSQNGGSLTLRDASLVGARSVGAVAQDEDSVAVLDRVTIDDVGLPPPGGDGTTPAGVLALFGGRVLSSDLRISRASGFGALAVGGDVVLNGARIEGVRPQPDGAGVRQGAMVAFDGGVILARRTVWRGEGVGPWAGVGGEVRVEGGDGWGAFAAVAGARSGRLSLTDVRLHVIGRGVALDAGFNDVLPGEAPAEVVAERALLTGDGQSWGLRACRGSVVARDVLLRDFDVAIDLMASRAEGDGVVVEGTGGAGILSRSAAAVDDCGRDGPPPPGAGTSRWARVAAYAPDEAAVDVGDGTEVVIDDLRVDGGEAPAARGRGVSIFGGGRLIARRARFERLGAVAMIVAEAESLLDASEVAVHAIDPDGAAEQGPGLAVQADARAVVQRLVVTRAHDVAVGVAGGALDASDLYVGETWPGPDGTGGVGVSVVEGGRASAERLVLSDNSGIGVLAHGGAEVALTDGWITATRADAIDGVVFRGVGAYAVEGGRLTLDGVLIEDSATAGLVGEGGRISGQRVAIRGVRPAAEGGATAGIRALASALLELSDFQVLDGGDVGVEVEASTARLTGGLIARNGWGVIGRLAAEMTLRDVGFEDNRDGELRCEDICVEAPPPVDDP